MEAQRCHQDHADQHVVESVFGYYPELGHSGALGWGARGEGEREITFADRSFSFFTRRLMYRRTPFGWFPNRRSPGHPLPCGVGKPRPVGLLGGTRKGAKAVRDLKPGVGEVHWEVAGSAA